MSPSPEHPILEIPARSVRVADFDYDLPPELIAQAPLPERDASRLLVVDRATATLHHSAIGDLPTWLAPGDLIVANNSRVIPARLMARKADTGGRVELLMLRADPRGAWIALARPARRLRPGQRLLVPPRADRDLPPLALEVDSIGEDGQVTLLIPTDRGFDLDGYGRLPLPPYIHAPLADPDRYQTIYATAPGSAAAPTAGLHVTPRLRERLRERGVGWAEVTLHIGLDTFRPVTSDVAEDHPIHREWCSVPDATARRVAATREHGGRIVALGTTAARTLETLGRRWDPARPAGIVEMTDLFILPGHRWRLVDALLTNFHLPRSTLLMMVSSFAGRELVLRAYREAVARRYRFYSFGDAMLIV